MRIKKRIALPMAFAMSAVVMLAIASLGNATHSVPLNASPIKVSLVPVYNNCPGTGGLTHGTPLAAPSCAPVLTGTGAQIAEPSPNGTSAGSATLKVLPGVPGPPDDSDVAVKSKITDVRCAAGATTACGSANTAGSPDYVGGLQGSAVIRITDHYNGVTGSCPPTCITPATVFDLPFSVTYAVAGCVASPGDPSIGTKCTADTSANAAVPGAVKDGQRADVEVRTIFINDGGPDGIVSPGTTSQFMTQGIFIP